MRRSWCVPAAAVAVAAVAALVIAGRAGAGVVTRTKTAPIRTRRLTPAERSAITVSSLSVTADPSFGLIVRVKFKGDVERYLGQGHLRSALLALVLYPASPPRAPAGTIDQSGGFTPVSIPQLKRAGKRVTVSRATVDRFAPEHTVALPASQRVSVQRIGSQAVFYLPARAVNRFARLKFEVFANGLVAPGGHPPSSSKLIAAKPTTATWMAIDPTKLSCGQLHASRSALSSLSSSALMPELRSQQQALRTLKAAVHNYTAIATLSQRMHAIPPLSRHALTGDVAATTNRIGRLRRQISAERGLTAQLDALIATACAPPPPPPPPPTPVRVVQTDAGLSEFMASQPGLTTSMTPPQGVPVIDVNDQVRYQRFSGLGAAMTDSSAWLIDNKLSASNRLALTQDLFGSAATPNALGAPAIHLNFLRVAMGASGAMTVSPPYTYDDNSNQPDPSLANFSTVHDEAYIVPTLQQALTINPGLQILASPWSPPAWMKSNDSLGNSNAQGSLLTADYSTYASYLVKFIQAYEQKYNLPIAAITPANEPTSGSGGGTPYPGLNFPEADEAQFIGHYLQPALSAARLDPKIYGTDLSWDQLAYSNSLASGQAAGDLGGIAWHCYFGSPMVMSQFHQTTPGLDQIVDECSPEIRAFGTPEFLISTLRNWASVVAIWSLALDPNGQPVQSGNHCGGCLGAVSIDQQTGAVSFRPEYYQLGQVSSYVEPGAARIDSANFVTYGVNSSNIETISSGLDDVAFENPDGSKVLIAYNNSSAPISFAVQSNGSYFSYTIPPRAMTTFVWG